MRSNTATPKLLKRIKSQVRSSVCTFSNAKRRRRRRRCVLTGNCQTAIVWIELLGIMIGWLASAVGWTGGRVVVRSHGSPTLADWRFCGSCHFACGKQLLQRRFVAFYVSECHSANVSCTPLLWFQSALAATFPLLHNAKMTWHIYYFPYCMCVCGCVRVCASGSVCGKVQPSIVPVASCKWTFIRSCTWSLALLHILSPRCTPSICYVFLFCSCCCTFFLVFIFGFCSSLACHLQFGTFADM